MIELVKGKKAKTEVEMIKKALENNNNNRTKAAEEPGISRRTLLYRIKQYNDIIGNLG